VSPDTTPPIIATIQAIPTNQSAAISWLTDDYATSRIDYGPTVALGSTVSTQALITSHSLVATGLAENTDYHYNVTSCNVDGYCTTTGPLSFRTLGPEQAMPFEQGFCTGQFIERGPNAVPGKIVKGDIFEYWCETPYMLRPRMPFQIALTVDTEDTTKDLRVPDARTGDETPIYP
jgi:hypothetical protein